MSALITTLRELTNTGLTDYSVGAVTYWTDDQLEKLLDAHQFRVGQGDLSARPELMNGSMVYYDYVFSEPFVERADTASAFVVRDGNGSAIGTAGYSVNYEAGIITFADDQKGSARYLNYRWYDVYGAAGDVYERKAAHASARFDITTDNHGLKQSQLVASYTRLAGEMRNRSRVQAVRWGRGGTLTRDDAV